MDDDVPPFGVRRYDAPGRYLVRSERPTCADSYLVEFGDRRFPQGRCSCVDWDIRIESAMRRGEEPVRLTCKHIDRVNAELHHARELCELAGLPFSPNIIPAA